MKNLDLVQRPRRNRLNSVIRDLVSEVTLLPQNLILPVFVAEGLKGRVEIKTMPGMYRNTMDSLLIQIEQSLHVGIKSFALFPALNEISKNKQATESINSEGFQAQVIRKIKQKFPEIVLITDVALDPFSSDGHDGFVENGEIVNDQTVHRLAEMALLQAQCGADIVAPSDMMDGRVGVIRKVLDQSGFTKTGILAYSAKYASSFYGPFRDALDSAPKAGDKKTYQMDFRNQKEALREVELDIIEGADMVMVKPALSYLDVINEVKKISSVPVAAYNVSGEYAMVKAAAQAGMINETAAMVETLYSIKRAGADIILTYFAVEMAKWLKGNV
jgi:porphobilinogen synthase